MSENTCVARAFSSEVDTGSREENASKQKSRAPFRFHRNGNGSSRSIDGCSARFRLFRSIYSVAVGQSDYEKMRGLLPDGQNLNRRDRALRAAERLRWRRPAPMTQAIARHT